MFGERNSGNSTIDYPLEGTKGIVEALLRGTKKFGGKVLLRSHVEEIMMEGIVKPHWLCSCIEGQAISKIPWLEDASPQP